MQQALRYKSAIAMAAVVALSGCATAVAQSRAGAESSAKAAEVPTLNVEGEISMLAKSIDSNLQKLTEIEQSAKQAKAPERPKAVSAAMALRVSVLWKGPAEPILAKLAEESGYEFKTIGKKGSMPILVGVDVKDQPVLDVLRSIGLQMGDRATVRVSQRDKMIEVAYVGN